VPDQILKACLERLRDEQVRVRVQQKTAGAAQICRSNCNQQAQLRPCPACRGYELERHWCGRCDGRGVVEVCA
jgi:hypothetical protein